MEKSEASTRYAHAAPLARGMARRMDGNMYDVCDGSPSTINIAVMAVHLFADTTSPQKTRIASGSVRAETAIHLLHLIWQRNRMLMEQKKWKWMRECGIKNALSLSHRTTLWHYE